MVKRRSIIILLACASAGVFGQQQSHYSQYMQNSLILNPATAGIKGAFITQLSHRSQWAGFEGGPKTYYLSTQAELTGTPPKSSCLMVSRPEMVKSRNYYLGRMPNSLRHGIGVTVIADQYGLFSKVSGNVNYALHAPLSSKLNVSAGLGAGLSNVKFDRDNATIPDPDDETYAAFTAQKSYLNYLDVNAGFWLYSKSFYVGYASNQLLRDKVMFGDFSQGVSVLNVHHYLTGGYLYQINPDLSMVPSVMLKLVQPEQLSIDINAKLAFRDMIWGGVSYRHKDAVTGMVGIAFNNLVGIGYSYDVTISDMNNYNSGSHEILLELKFQQAHRMKIPSSFF